MDRVSVIRLLKQQREIFGDQLFSKISFKLPNHASLSVKEESAVYNAPAIIKTTQRADDAAHVLADIPAVFNNITTLHEFERKICNCQKCDLAKTRNKFVFGKGNSAARVMLIGEGPGADEDREGEPFVGKSGQLLTDILKAIQLTREEIYIANIIKCRPPANRTPFPAEVEACFPYLQKQINLIQPSIILLLGATAVLGVLGKKQSLSAMRGKIFQYGSAQVLVTYHPAALLRNPALKRATWEDVQKLRKLYDELPSA